MKLFDNVNEPSIVSYAKLIDATYTWTILFVTGFGTVLLNLVGLQVKRSTNNKYLSDLTTNLRVNSDSFEKKRTRRIREIHGYGVGYNIAFLRRVRNFRNFDGSQY